MAEETGGQWQSYEFINTRNLTSLTKHIKKEEIISLNGNLKFLISNFIPKLSTKKKKEKNDFYKKIIYICKIRKIYFNNNIKQDFILSNNILKA